MCDKMDCHIFLPSLPQTHTHLYKPHCKSCRGALQLVANTPQHTWIAYRAFLERNLRIADVFQMAKTLGKKPASF